MSHATNALRCLCVGHALKETLSASQTRDLLVSVCEETGCVVTGKLCISDGGDGFLEAWQTLDSQVRPVKLITPDALGRPISTEYLISDDASYAVIESAQVIGLRQISPSERHILRSSSTGLADLLADALNRGTKVVYVGVGGTATCDGGWGFLARLAQIWGGIPARPWEELTASALPVAQLSMNDLRARLSRVRLVGCLDVENPLCGPNGAAHQFAPQKGATAEQVDWLDSSIARWAASVEASLGISIQNRPGAGAGGGLGFALMALGAEIRVGASVFLEHATFKNAITACDLVLTAEGKFDCTSLHGKAPWRVALAARKLGKGAVILCARGEPEAIAEAQRHGVTVIPFAQDLEFEQARARTPELIRKALELLFHSGR